MPLPNLQDEHAHKLITVTPHLTLLTLGGLTLLTLGGLTLLALKPITEHLNPRLARLALKPKFRDDLPEVVI